MRVIDKLQITPGPWDVLNYYGDVNTVGTDKTDVCDVHNWKLSGIENSRLIAAAPEMLEALIIDLIKFGEDEGCEIKIHAVEKATGRTWSEIKELIE